VRFNGVYRGGQTPVEWMADQRALALFGLDYRGDRVRLSADLGYQYQYISGALPYLGLSPGTVPLPWAPKARSNPGQPWNFSERKDLFGVVRGEFDLTERITAYAAFGAHDNRAGTFRRRSAHGHQLQRQRHVLALQSASVYTQYLTGEVGLRGRAETGPIGTSSRCRRRASGARTGSVSSTARPSPQTSTIPPSSRGPISRSLNPTRCHRWSRAASPSPIR
jgi:iron complex outermembrane receptor protein